MELFDYAFCAYVRAAGPPAGWSSRRRQVLAVVPRLSAAPQVQRHGFAAGASVLDHLDAASLAALDAGGVPRHLADHPEPLCVRVAALIGEDVARPLRGHAEDVIVGEAACLERIPLVQGDGSNAIAAAVGFI